MAEIADGWMLAQVWPGLFGKLWPKLEGHLRERGRDPETFPNIAYHNINIANDRAAALEETRRFLHEYYGPVFSRRTGGRMDRRWDAPGVCRGPQ